MEFLNLLKNHGPLLEGIQNLAIFLNCKYQSGLYLLKFAIIKFK